MEPIDINSLVVGVLSRAPEWIRKDLAGKDAYARQRAEEALAALISAVLLPALAKDQDMDPVAPSVRVDNE